VCKQPVVSRTPNLMLRAALRQLWRSHKPVRTGTRETCLMHSAFTNFESGHTRKPPF